MKTIIAGGREIKDEDFVIRAIGLCPWAITELVSGGCRGVDTIAAEWWESYGFEPTKFPADWNKYGKSAGPRRNKQMAEYAEALILIWDGRSSGSASMLEFAQERNLYILDIRYNVFIHSAYAGSEGLPRLT